MKHRKSNRTTSFKAKIILFIIPLLGLVFIELIARFIEPSEYIPDIGSGQPSHLSISDDNGLINEQTLLANYELIKIAVRMLQFPFHQMERDCFYTLIPNASFSFRKPGSYIVNYKINSLGFRNEEFAIEKEKNNLRILCAGDSSTFGYFMNLFDTYPKKLEMMLKTKTVEKNAEVINTGMLAYSSYQGVKFIEKYARKLKPDILVISYGYNDSFVGYLSDPEVKLSSSSNTKMKKTLEKLAAYRLAERILSPSKIVDLTSRSITRVSLVEYKDNLEMIYFFAKQDGTYLILLPISAPIAYQKVMREFAVEKDCGFIDMESILQSYHKKFLAEGPSEYEGIPFGKIVKRSFDDYHYRRFGSKEMVEMRQFNYLFMDYCHPTPVGYQIIAESLYDYLIQHGFFKKAEGKTTKPPPKIQSLTVKSNSIPDLIKLP